MEDITDADCMHTKSVCKNFEMEIVGEYYELYQKFVFRNLCLEIYQLDPVEFISVQLLAWQAALKKIKVKLELLTDIKIK